MNDSGTKAWAEKAWQNAEKKIRRNAEIYGSSLLETAYDGKWYVPDYLNCWTDGFWPGILWLTYEVTGEERFLRFARECEEKMDSVLKTPENIGHDSGFMWSLMSVADYKLTGSDAAKRRGIRAAMSLASRFNPSGRFIRSWGDIPGKDTKSWTIVDNAMNLPILFWCSEVQGDPRFSNIACIHADTMLKYTVRPDGSVNHIIKIDPYTGEYIGDREDCLEYTQGCGLESSWTRGQAWAIYGMALAYRYTKNKEYLDAAKRCAHYFLACLDETFVPPIDFRGEAEKMGRDSSAGAIAACGVLEIAQHVPECEKRVYFRGAERILKGLEKYCTSEAEEVQCILMHGATHYNATKTRDVGLIYGDYFYLEAIGRIYKDVTVFW